MRCICDFILIIACSCSLCAVDDLAIDGTSLTGPVEHIGYGEITVSNSSVEPAAQVSLQCTQRVVLRAGSRVKVGGQLSLGICDPLPPTDINLSNDVVVEGSPVGTTVGILSAVDASPGDIHVFSILPGGDAADFSIVGDELHVDTAVTLRGPYGLTIRVIDSEGGIFDKAFSITVNDLPIIEDPLPVDVRRIRDHLSVTLSATATDADGIASVAFYLDGTLQSTVTSAPYEYDLGILSPGEYEWHAVATDTNGVSTQLPVQSLGIDHNPGPVLSGTSPADGIEVLQGDPVLFSVDASDAVDGVTSVSFLIDGVSYVGTANGSTFEYSHDTSAMASGMHSWNVLATDGTGVTSSLDNDLQVLINAAPVFESTSPSDGSRIRDHLSVTLSVTVSDDVGIASVAFYLDGSLQVSVTSEPYLADLGTMSPGEYEWHAIVTDTSGAVAQLPVQSLGIDHNPGPVLASASPADGIEVLQGDPVLFSVDASDAVDGVTSVSFLIDGVSYVGTANGSTFEYSHDTSAMASGMHDWNVVATDGTGVTSSLASDLQVLINTAPVFDATTPADGSRIRDHLSVTLSALVSDDVGIASVAFYWEGSLQATVTTAPYEHEIGILVPGDYEWYAIVTDSSAVSTQLPVQSLGIDHNPGPVLSNASPVDGFEVIEGDPVSLSIDASDAVDGVISVSFLVDGVPHAGTASGSTFEYSHDTSGMSTGAHVWNVLATDGTGITSVLAADKHFNIDTPPVFGATNPADGSRLRDHLPVTLSVSVSDDDGIASVAFYLDGSLQSTLTAPPYELDLGLLEPGEYNWYAIAIDGAGGSAQLSDHAFGIDHNAGPELTTASPADAATFVVGEIIHFQIDASDVEDGVESLTFLVDGSVVGVTSEAPYRVSFDTSSLTPGAHSWNVIATDGSGVTSSLPSDLQLVVSAAPVSPKLSTLVVIDVGDTWQQVDLPESFANPVVIATPAYTQAQAPAVTRVRVEDGDTIAVRMQNPQGLPLSGYAVHLVVAESGVFTQAEHGIDMVVAKQVVSQVDDSPSTWVGTGIDASAFSNPVILGQVMGDDESQWTVFWSCGSAATEPPSSAAAKIGRHVGQDPILTRADQTIGYIIIEAGSGEIDGVPYTAAIGADTVVGITDGLVDYALSGVTIPQVAACSMAGMDGSDGGWPVLHSTPFSGATMTLAVDEDQLADSERNHTTEQLCVL